MTFRKTLATLLTTGIIGLGSLGCCTPNIAQPPECNLNYNEIKPKAKKFLDKIHSLYGENPHVDDINNYLDENADENTARIIKEDLKKILKRRQHLTDCEIVGIDNVARAFYPL